MLVYTVTIINRDIEDSDPWVSCFSEQAKAVDFAAKAREKLKHCGADAFVQVEPGTAELDSDAYLGWIQDCYGDDRCWLKTGI